MPEYRWEDPEAELLEEVKQEIVDAQMAAFEEEALDMDVDGCEEFGDEFGVGFGDGFGGGTGGKDTGGKGEEGGAGFGPKENQGKSGGNRRRLKCGSTSGPSNQENGAKDPHSGGKPSGESKQPGEGNGKKPPKRRLEEATSLKKLMTVQLVDTQGKNLTSNLEKFEVTAMTESSIDLKIKFAKSFDSEASLMIQFNFSSFEKTWDDS